MNITIITNNYYPEDSGIGLYSAGMAEYLAEKHEVKIISAMPYYPQWEIYPEYKSKGSYFKEIINKVIVYRFKTYVPKNPNFAGRILQIISFFFGSLVNVFKIKKSDVIIVVVPFTISVILGMILRKLFGGKLWIHVQDFEFDAAFQTGLSSEKSLKAKMFFKIESFIYKRADKLSTISNGMLNKMKEKTKNDGFLFPNWIDYSKINPEIAKHHPIINNNFFNILYSGNIGAKQDWEFFNEFVLGCQELDNVKIILIGDGAMKKEVLKNLKSFKNCSYHPPVRYEDLNDLLCNADLHILFQKDSVVESVMPSKILGMMASSKPSLVTGHDNSEVQKVFEISNGGYYFSGKEKLSNCIQIINELSSDKEKGNKMGKNARNFIVESFSKEKVLKNFEKEIENLVNDKK